MTAPTLTPVEKALDLLGQRRSRSEAIVAAMEGVRYWQKIQTLLTSFARPQLIAMQKEEQSATIGHRSAVAFFAAAHRHFVARKEQWSRMYEDAGWGSQPEDSWPELRQPAFRQDALELLDAAGYRAIFMGPDDLDEWVVQIGRR